MSGICCPKCGHPGTGVTDSRPVINSIRRRRECDSCHHRFTTHELVDGSDNIPHLTRFIAVQNMLAEAATKLAVLLDPTLKPQDDEQEPDARNPA